MPSFPVAEPTIKNRIARSVGRGGYRLPHPYDADRHRIDQNILVIAGVKIYLATHDRDTKAIAVIADPLDHAGHQVFGVGELRVAEA